MEAFTDGVIAVIITIMVLDLKIPHGDSLVALREQIPVFLSYILSFIYIGIYWNNHHHMMKAVEHISGVTLWANLHLLFWLSLAPFVTGWMGENHFATWPVACFGFVVFMAGVAYYILVRALIACNGEDSELARSIGNDGKGKLSVLVYAIAVGVAFVNRWVAIALYIAVALMWLVPDRRIEQRCLPATNEDQD